MFSLIQQIFKHPLHVQHYARPPGNTLMFRSSISYWGSASCGLVVVKAFIMVCKCKVIPSCCTEHGQRKGQALGAMTLATVAAHITSPYAGRARLRNSIAKGQWNYTVWTWSKQGAWDAKLTGTWSPNPLLPSLQWIQNKLFCKNHSLTVAKFIVCKPTFITGSGIFCLSLFKVDYIYFTNKKVQWSFRPFSRYLSRLNLIITDTITRTRASTAEITCPNDTHFLQTIFKVIRTVS